MSHVSQLTSATSAYSETDNNYYPILCLTFGNDTGPIFESGVCSPDCVRHAKERHTAVYAWRTHEVYAT